MIYSNTQFHASLNGTPPAISSRYCSLPLPYDISDEDLFLPQAELVKVVAGLGRNGWNQKGSYHATFIRAQQYMARIREEILEVSLGVDVLLSQDRLE